LAKAKVFRSGVHFPAFSFEKHAETEGFGKMAKRMKFSVVGLPHYTIWHLYEPSVDDRRHMEEMENERRAKEAEEKAKKERLDKIHDQFENPNNQWESDKNNINDLAKDEYVKNQDIKEASGEESDSTPVKKAEKQPEKHSEELPDKDSEDKAKVGKTKEGKAKIVDPLNEVPAIGKKPAAPES
jgi:mannan polymerase II complex ANP1 subunit